MPGPEAHHHHPDPHHRFDAADAQRLLVGRDSDARLVADAAGVGAGDHVVDLGCGPGVAVREAIRRGARATGVDPTPAMLELARRQAGNGDARWVEGSAEAVPLGDGDATVVWAIGAAHHWSDVAQALSEVVRVLAAGGRLIVLERGWTDEQVASFVARCEAAGLADVVVDRREREDLLRAVRG